MDYKIEQYNFIEKFIIFLENRNCILKSVYDDYEYIIYNDELENFINEYLKQEGIK